MSHTEYQEFSTAQAEVTDESLQFSRRSPPTKPLLDHVGDHQGRNRLTLTCIEARGEQQPSAYDQDVAALH